MTSWTAEVEWHEDMRRGGDNRPVALLEQGWGTVHEDPATGTITATVTTEAPDLVLALEAVLLLARDVAGQHVTVNRIASTDAYHREPAPSRA